MISTQIPFARVTLEHDKANERAPLEAITKAIFETSRLSDCNTVETAEALLAMLTGKRLLRGVR